MAERENNFLTSKPVTVWNEYIWPFVSNVLAMRPLHFAATRFLSGIQKGDKVLELGAGYPLYELYADKVGKEGMFVALDNNAAIQKRSRFLSRFVDKYIRDGKKTTDQVVATVTDLPFSDNTFDQVLVSHGPFDPEEVLRVLKPGGRFLMSHTEMLYGVPIFTVGHYLQFKDSNFEGVKIFPGAPMTFLPALLGMVSLRVPLYFGLNWYLSAGKPHRSSRGS